MGEDKTGSAGMKNVGLQVAILVASGLASTGLWNVARAAAEKYDRTANMRKHWNEVLALYPEELGGEREEQSKRNFEAIYRIAPSVAKIPPASIHYLRIANDYDTGGFDPSTIETLAKTEFQIAQARDKKYAPIKELRPDAKSIVEAMGASPDITTLPIGLNALMG